MTGSLAINGFADREDAAVSDVKAPAFFVDDTGFVAQCTQNGIVKILGILNVVSANHDMTEHFYSPSLRNQNGRGCYPAIQGRRFYHESWRYALRRSFFYFLSIFRFLSIFQFRQSGLHLLKLSLQFGILSFGFIQGFLQ